ncbi:MAG: RHS repeat-associated core domain-containing protein [Myxococcota bacterium]
MAELPVSVFGPGWGHQYDYWLVEDYTGTGNEWLLYHPTGEVDTLLVNVTSSSGTKLTVTAGTPNVVLEGGKSIEFETAPSTGSLLIYRAKTISKLNVYAVDLTYYGSLASGLCNSADPDYVDRLCTVVDEAGGTVHFETYDSTHGYLTRIEAGRSESVMNHVVRYSYDGIDLFDGATLSGSIDLLASRSFEASDGSVMAAFSESYEHSSLAYYRPDLAGSSEFFQAANERIAAGSGWSRALLTVVRLDGEFVSGHRYDAWGRAVTSETSGQFLRFEYVAASTDGTTVVTNESSGEVTEYRYDEFGDVYALAGDCDCESNPEAFEYNASGVLVAVRAEPALEGMPNATVGVRTTFGYSAAGRLDLVQRNWEGDPNTPSSNVVGDGVSITEYAYDAGGDGPLTQISRAVSAPCETTNGVLTCPGSYAAPARIYDFDTGSDAYDHVYNEQAKPVTADPTQIVRRGLTLSDVSASSLTETQYHVEYRYDATGRVQSITYPSSLHRPAAHVTTFDYYGSTGNNNASRLHRMLEGGVAVREFRDYDSSGRAGTVEELETGIVTTRSFGVNGRIDSLSVSDGLGETRTTTFLYDSQGRLIEQSQSANSMTESLVTMFDLFSGHTGDPSPDATDFCDTSGAAGSVATKQAACVTGLGSLGRITDIRRGLGVATQFQLTNRTTMTYDSLGNALSTAQFDPLDNLHRYSTYEFDRDGAQTRHWAYSDNTAQITGNAFLTESYRNMLGALVKQTDPRFASVGADRTDNEQDANVVVSYDRLGRIASRTVGIDGSDPGVTTTYQYDAHGNLRTVTDANGNATTYVYDDFGRLLVVDSPDSGETRYAYDSRDRLVERRTEDGAITQYSYDGRGRITAQAFDIANGPHSVDRRYYYNDFSAAPVSPPVSCANPAQTFDPGNTAGRLAWVSHGAGATYYGYDSFGAVNAVFEQVGSTFNVCTLRIHRYEHDGLGRLTKITYPSRRSIIYSYQVPGSPDAYYDRVAQIELERPDGSTLMLVDSIEYDAAGQVTGYNAGSVSLVASFDLGGRFIERDYAATADHRFHWTIDLDQDGVDLQDRDAGGNPLRFGDAARGKTIDASYDAQSRLTSATGTNLRGYQDCNWEYDDVGNRVGETCYGKRVSYEIESGGNQLLSTSFTTNAAACNDPDTTVTQTRSRDVVGRQTNAFKGRFGDATEDFTLEYGPDTRLERAYSVSSGYSYVYDHRMLRSRTTNYTTLVPPFFTSPFRETVYGVSGNLLHEKKMYSDEVHEYVWLGSTPVALLVDSDGPGAGIAAPMPLGVDHLGTPHRAWGHGSGTTTWAGDYEAFGTCTTWLPGGGSPTVDVSLRFPGQLEDAETGMHYNWWRYYVASTGKYATPDPLGRFGRDPTLFSYGASSPFVYVDPLGLIIRCPSGETSRYSSVILKPGSKCTSTNAASECEYGRPAEIPADWRLQKVGCVDDGEGATVTCEWCPGKGGTSCGN